MMSVELRGGRYALLKPLGEGTQGETFEAVDKREGRLVAVKRFRVGNAKAWKDVELAEREAATLASLSHELLPRYVEHFEEDGALVLVMERIEGESLAALRKRGHRGSVSEIERLLRDASRALAYLHGRSPPVIHRDLKPGNVIRRPDGSFAFVDFGAVRDRLKIDGGSTVVGTFGFMAPEQFQGRASAATDVYGIGATALALLTGKEPEDLPHRGLGIDVARAVPDATPRSLVRALEAMLEPDPDQRASSIAEALERGGAGAPVVARTAARLGIFVAQLVVWVTVGLAAPVVLIALSLIFGGALRRAAAACFEASKRANARMARAASFDGAARASVHDPARRDEPGAARARVKADDVLRRVRSLTPEEAQQEAIRRVGMSDAEAEAWADEVATREAERWEPPEAWQDDAAAKKRRPGP
jgi:hypothetical protein